MKKYFITGLVILLPVALTLAIVIFIINLLTQPFVGIFKSIMGHYRIFDGGFLFFTTDQLQVIFSQILILILLFFFTVALGLLARWFFFHYIIGAWDALLHRIPFISSVYKGSKDVINTIFTSNTSSFKQVVMVPFPRQETYSIGLVTREEIKEINPKEPETEYVAVFVPTTPNPTSGFLMMFKRTDLIYLDMKVEEALKYIISCGVIKAPIIQKTKVIETTPEGS